MDPFTLIIVGGMAALILAIVLLGKYYPGSGADVVDWKPTRSVEVEAELELEDVAQMIEAQNARRRRRGLPEISEEEIRDRVAADRRETDALREAYLADEDVSQMLDLKNSRRRKRGLPELTLAELRTQLGVEEPPAR